MSDEHKDVSCGNHGQRPPACMCRHLLEGSRLGFNYACDEDEPDAWFPDAWCDECDKVWTQAGAFTGEVAAQLDIKVVCSECYEEARERNWLQDDARFERLLEESIANLEDRQARLWDEFRIDECDQYRWDQDTGQLVFTQGGKPRVTADFVFVGSISTHSNTWLWSWANSTDEEPRKALMRTVRAYGDEHRFRRLAAAHWSGEEHDGWQMTAIAAHLLGAAGAYRTPSDHGYTFLLMTCVNWVE